MYVPADLCGSALSSTSAANTCLDVGGFVFGDLGCGLVDDELAAHELGAFHGRGFDLVAGRAALEADDRFELVAPVGGRGQSEPATDRAVCTHVANDTAGMWWHSSTTTRP